MKNKVRVRIKKILSFFLSASVFVSGIPVSTVQAAEVYQPEEVSGIVDIFHDLSEDGASAVISLLPAGSDIKLTSVELVKGKGKKLTGSNEDKQEEPGNATPSNATESEAKEPYETETEEQVTATGSDSQAAVQEETSSDYAYQVEENGVYRFRITYKAGFEQPGVIVPNSGGSGVEKPIQDGNPEDGKDPAGSVDPDGGNGSVDNGSGEAGSGNVDSGSGEAGNGNVDSGSGETGNGNVDSGSGETGNGNVDSGSGEAGSGSVDSGSGDAGNGNVDSGSGEGGSGSVDSGSGEAGSGSADSGSSDSGSGSADSGSSDSGSGDADSGSSDSGSGSADDGSVDTGNGDTLAENVLQLLFPAMDVYAADSEISRTILVEYTVSDIDTSNRIEFKGLEDVLVRQGEEINLLDQVEAVDEAGNPVETIEVKSIIPAIEEATASQGDSVPLMMDLEVITGFEEAGEKGSFIAEEPGSYQVNYSAVHPATGEEYIKTRSLMVRAAATDGFTFFSDFHGTEAGKTTEIAIGERQEGTLQFTWSLPDASGRNIQLTVPEYVEVIYTPNNGSMSTTILSKNTYLIEINDSVIGVASFDIGYNIDLSSESKLSSEDKNKLYDGTRIELGSFSVEVNAAGSLIAKEEIGPLTIKYIPYSDSAVDSAIDFFISQNTSTPHIYDTRIYEVELSEVWKGKWFPTSTFDIQKFWLIAGSVQQGHIPVKLKTLKIYAPKGFVYRYHDDRKGLSYGNDIHGEYMLIDYEVNVNTIGSSFTYQELTYRAEHPDSITVGEYKQEIAPVLTYSVYGKEYSKTLFKPIEVHVKAQKIEKRDQLRVERNPFSGFHPDEKEPVIAVGESEKRVELTELKNGSEHASSINGTTYIPTHKSQGAILKWDVPDGLHISALSLIGSNQSGGYLPSDAIKADIDRIDIEFSNSGWKQVNLDKKGGGIKNVEAVWDIPDGDRVKTIKITVNELYGAKYQIGCDLSFPSVDDIDTSKLMAKCAVMNFTLEYPEKTEVQKGTLHVRLQGLTFGIPKYEGTGLARHPLFASSDVTSYIKFDGEGMAKNPRFALNMENGIHQYFNRKIKYTASSQSLPRNWKVYYEGSTGSRGTFSLFPGIEMTMPSLAAGETYKKVEIFYDGTLNFKDMTSLEIGSKVSNKELEKYPHSANASDLVEAIIPGKVTYTAEFRGMNKTEELSTDYRMGLYSMGILESPQSQGMSNTINNGSQGGSVTIQFPDKPALRIKMGSTVIPSSILFGDVTYYLELKNTEYFLFESLTGDQETAEVVTREGKTYLKITVPQLQRIKPLPGELPIYSFSKGQLQISPSMSLNFRIMPGTPIGQYDIIDSVKVDIARYRKIVEADEHQFGMDYWFLPKFDRAEDDVDNLCQDSLDKKGRMYRLDGRPTAVTVSKSNVSGMTSGVGVQGSYQENSVEFNNSKREQLNAYFNISTEEELTDYTATIKLPREGKTLVYFSSGVTAERLTHDYSIALRGPVNTNGAAEIKYSIGGRLYSADQVGNRWQEVEEISINLPKVAANSTQTFFLDLQTGEKPNDSNDNLKAYLAASYQFQGNTGSITGWSALNTFTYRDTVISGRLWHDANEDGRRGSEPAMAGETVSLTVSGRDLSTTTDNKGDYEFRVPNADGAVITIQKKDGWKPTVYHAAGVAETENSDFDRENWEYTAPSDVSDLSNIDAGFVKLPTVTAENVEVKAGMEQAVVVDSSTGPGGQKWPVHFEQANDMNVATVSADGKVTGVTAGGLTQAEVWVENTLGDKVTASYQISVGTNNAPELTVHPWTAVEGDTVKDWWYGVTATDPEDEYPKFVRLLLGPVIKLKSIIDNSKEVKFYRDFSHTDEILPEDALKSPGEYYLKYIIEDDDGNKTEKDTTLQVYGKVTLSGTLTEHYFYTGTDPVTPVNTGIQASYQSYDGGEESISGITMDSFVFPPHGGRVTVKAYASHPITVTEGVTAGSGHSAEKEFSLAVDSAVKLDTTALDKKSGRVEVIKDSSLDLLEDVTASYNHIGDTGAAQPVNPPLTIKDADNGQEITSVAAADGKGSYLFDTSKTGTYKLIYEATADETYNGNSKNTKSHEVTVFVYEDENNDGIPDIYQIEVSYKAVGGTVSFAGPVAVTLMKGAEYAAAADGGVGHLSADQIPTAASYPGYRQDSLTWKPNTPNTTRDLTVGIEYTAEFAEDDAVIQYTVDDSTMGSVSKSTETVKAVSGTAQGAVAAAKTGYAFKYWKDSSGAIVGTNPELVPPKANGAGGAYYKAESYTACFGEDQIGGGNGGGDGIPDDFQIQVTYTIDPLQGILDFTGPIILTLMKDGIHAEPAQGGTAVLMPGQIPGVTAYSGYDGAAVTWSPDIAGTLSSDQLFTASLGESGQVKITYSPEDTKMGSVSSQEEYINPVSGTANGSTATASAGYAFKYWTDKSGNIVGWDETLTPGKIKPDVGSEYYGANDYTAHFSSDTKGGVDAGGNETGDGVPDEYQIQVTYEVENGTIDFTGPIHLTLKKDGHYPAPGEQGSAKLSADQIPAVKPDQGYKAPATWLPVEPGVGVEITGDIKFKASFGEADDVQIQYRLADLAMGTVSRADEMVAPVSGSAQGSEATANEGYAFKYWTDQKGNIVSWNAMFVPSKVSGTAVGGHTPDPYYESAVYTAHFSGDTEGGENGKGDGIPDEYQIAVTYEAVNGEAEFAGPVYVTLMRDNHFESAANGGTGRLTKAQIPKLTPHTGYDKNRLNWSPAEPAVDLELQWPTKFTGTFGEAGNIEIKYLSADENMGTVTSTGESLAPVTGIARGAAATAEPGYGFKYWTDKSGAVVSWKISFVPEKIKSATGQDYYEENTYTAHFSSDQKGSVEPDGSEKGDGVPDEYQVKVSYQAVNGDLSFQNPVYVTLKTDGHHDTNGKGYLSLSQIPSAAPHPGFDPATESWTPQQPSVTMEIVSGQEYKYTVSFQEGGPVTLSYESADPAMGTVDRDSEALKPVTGIAKGSKASAAKGYGFKYWTDGNNKIVSWDAEFIPEPKRETGKKPYYQDAVYTAHFSSDTKGGEDGTGDGIPDEYQIKITYGVTNGTIAFTGPVYATLKKDGHYDKDGEAYLQADQIPAVTPYAGYDSTARWTPHTPDTSTALKADTDFKAVFGEASKVTIRYQVSDQGGGSVSLTEENVLPVTGSPQGAIANANSGSAFKYWTDKDGKIISRDKTLIPTKTNPGNGLPAYYEPAVYTAHFSTDTSGGGSGGGTGDGIPDEYQVAVEYKAVNGTVTITAPVYVTLEKDGHPENAANGGKGYLKADQIAAATAGPGYDQNSLQWTPAEPSTSYELTAPMTFTAEFKEAGMVTIRYQASDESMGSVSRASESVAPVTGTALGSKATANEGSSFKNWTDTKGNIVSWDAEFKPAKNQGQNYVDAVYTANFTSIPVISGENIKLYAGETYDQSKLKIVTTDKDTPASDLTLSVDDGHVKTGIPGTYQVKAAVRDADNNSAETWLYVQVYGKPQVPANPPLYTRTGTVLTREEMLVGLEISYQEPAPIPETPWSDRNKINGGAAAAWKNITDKAVILSGGNVDRVAITQISMEVMGAMNDRPDDGKLLFDRDLYVFGVPKIVLSDNSLYAHEAVSSQTLIDAVKTGRGLTVATPASASVEYVGRSNGSEVVWTETIHADEITYQVEGFSPTRPGSYTVKASVDDSNVISAAKAPGLQPARGNAEAVVSVDHKYYDITFLSGANGGYAPGAQTVVPVAHGKAVTPPGLAPDEGYELDHWIDQNGNIIQNLSTHPFVAEDTLTPVFTVKRYTVRFIGRRDRVIKTETVLHGRNATPPVDDKDVTSTRFFGWSLSHENVTEDRDIYATFWTSGGGGSGPGGGGYKPGGPGDKPGDDTITIDPSDPPLAPSAPGTEKILDQDTPLAPGRVKKQSAKDGNGGVIPADEKPEYGIGAEKIHDEDQKTPKDGAEKQNPAETEAAAVQTQAETGAEDRKKNCVTHYILLLVAALEGLYYLLLRRKDRKADQEPGDSEED